MNTFTAIDVLNKGGIIEKRKNTIFNLPRCDDCIERKQNNYQSTN